MASRLLIGALVLVCALALAVRASRADESGEMESAFQKQVAPILVARCLECHAEAHKGGLDLRTRATALAGGDSGAAIEAGKPAQSLLFQRVTDHEMPPKKPLAAQQVAVLKRWISEGAYYPERPLDPFAFTSDRRAGYDWWALQPVLRPSLPPVSKPAYAANPIDRFILAKLDSQGLSPSAPAERRVLIRRLYYDLLGLPPSPEAVERFVADSRPDAYERLVDQLLASPEYGVRWARHWLDLARFGESQGFERDKLRENSWPYRDWIVDAFNRDLPYDTFARRQLAGDALAPDDAGAVAATGFLVAGPYDEVGQSQQSQAMKAVVREDELEDLVSVVCQTFLGLTVNCARCHDHKFDPIRQEEYYRLASALSGVRHGERTLPVDQRRARELGELASAIKQQLRELEAPVREKILQARSNSTDDADKRPADPQPIAVWDFDSGPDDRIGKLTVKVKQGANIDSDMLRLDGKGYAATDPLPVDVKEKTLEAWIRLDDLTQRGGAAISLQSLDGAVFDAIVFGEREPGHWMAGSDFFRRTQPLEGPAESEATDRPVHVAIAYGTDGAITAYRDGQPYGKPYKTNGPVTFAAGKSQLVFGLRHSPPADGKLLRGGILRARLYDRALSPEEIAASAGARSQYVSEEQLSAALSDAQRQQRRQLQQQLASVQSELAQQQPVQAYVNVPRQPEPTRLLLRGNPGTPDRLVTPGGVAAVVGVDADFQLPADAPQDQRRRRLAEWITDRRNPLFARTIVNRLWHYHFGTGLVESTSDLGFNGSRPSHTELLDWLAAELVASDWSLKHLHRLIVTSATYRQSSADRPPAARIDADNRLLWRFNPHRLDAESLRDSLLLVAGQLDRRRGGPGYRDFVTRVQNSQFYEPIDEDRPEFHRRTLYRTWIRSGRDRLLDAFDCPDPSTKTPRRASTTTPLQALALLNHTFSLAMADGFAERIEREAGDDPGTQVDRAFRLIHSRRPTAQERQASLEFVTRHKLPALCRVLFNSNEFLYVD